MYIFDSHVHSNNSFDAKDSIKDLCEFAIENNIGGFSITDHLEINEYDKEYENSIRKSHEQTREAIVRYLGKLDLTVGIEMGQPLQNIDVSELVLEKFPCDFIIGSMHNPVDEKDFYFMEKEDFEHRIDYLLEKYYEEYYNMTKWGKFDVIGHITYPLRYIEGIYNIKVDMSKYDEVIYEMLKLAIKKDIGIEINVSGFRQPYNRQFPELNHIKEYVNNGGKIITLGSDSHDRYSLGQNFKQGKELIESVGLKEYCYFKNRTPYFINL